MTIEDRIAQANFQFQERAGKTPTDVFLGEDEFVELIQFANSVGIMASYIGPCMPSTFMGMRIRRTHDKSLLACGVEYEERRPAPITWVNEKPFTMEQVNRVLGRNGKEGAKCPRS